MKCINMYCKVAGVIFSAYDSGYFTASKSLVPSSTKLVADIKVATFKMFDAESPFHHR